MTRHLVIWLLALVWVVPAVGLESVDEIVDCIGRNEPARAAEQTIVLSSKDRSGAWTHMRANLYWRRKADGLSEVSMRIFEPPDSSGSGLLVRELAGDDGSETLLYLPDVGATKRVTRRQAATSLFGTDFSYEDFERIYCLRRDAALERLPDAAVDDHRVYVLEGRTPEGVESPYERVVLSVDQETCVPLRTELYERGNRLRKRMTVDPSTISVKAGRRIPLAVRIQDLRHATESEIRVEQMEVDAPVASEYFTVAWLESGQGAPRVSGADLIKSYGCQGCHVIGGTGGTLGPELDTVFERRDEAYVRSHIQNPQQHIATSLMPNFGLSDAQILAILETLGAPGDAGGS